MRFADEAPPRFGVAGKLLAELLDRDAAAEFRIRARHTAETAATLLVDDLIATEKRPRLQAMHGPRFLPHRLQLPAERPAAHLLAETLDILLDRRRGPEAVRSSNSP